MVSLASEDTTDDSDRIAKEFADVITIATKAPRKCAQGSFSGLVDDRGGAPGWVSIQDGPHVHIQCLGWEIYCSTTGGDDGDSLNGEVDQPVGRRGGLNAATQFPLQFCRYYTFQLAGAILVFIPLSFEQGFFPIEICDLFSQPLNGSCVGRDLFCCIGEILRKL
ncbi:hypothetical protein CFM90_11130 [Ralstonia solanacearum]|nr:hypothetical protein CFM90_11130 [Ralstonia solanacearum]